MRATYTAADLLELKLPCLPGTERGVRLRAERENWPFKYEQVHGGYQKRYYSHLLPMEIRQAILALDKIDAMLPAHQQPKPANLPPVTQAQETKAMAKADLLRHYLQSLAKSPWGKKEQTRSGFMQAYNSGIAFPELFATLGHVSWQTIEGWKRTVKQSGDTYHLADRRGTAKKGLCVLSEMQTDILLACALRQNEPKISESIRLAKDIMASKGLDTGHHEATYRRWLEGWIKVNYPLWVFKRQGRKAWVDNCCLYIERNMNLIEVGDMIVADGHNLNFEIIDPKDGKRKNHMVLILFFDMRSSFPLGWEIMPTENTQAISSALRRSIIRLGKMPQVVYLDNGRAFKSKYFQGSTSFDEAGYAGLYQRLGIHTIFAWPYNGQSKPIERFFGSMGEAERLNAISYTGTSIAKKPARLQRNEKVHRAVHEKAFGDRCLTLAEAHQLIATWFDAYVNRVKTGKSHLQGQRPIDVFMEGRGPGVDIPALDYLMMSEEVKTLHRNGFTFRKQNYFHPALHNLRHKVLIRYDMQDLSSILVYREDGSLICRAEPMLQVHPAASHLGNDADVKLLEGYIEIKKQQEKAAGSAKTFLAEVVMPEHQRQLDSMGITGQVVDIGAKRVAAKQLPAPLTTADHERIMAEAAAAQAEQASHQAEQLNLELESLSEADRYERLLGMEMTGQLVPKRWLAFMRYYEAHIDATNDHEYWDARKAALAIMYGQQKRAEVAASAHE